MKRLLRKFNLWLIAHGVEFEVFRNDYGMGHSFSVAINHRYYGVEIGVRPYRGVYTDELNTPHAEIAKQRAERGAE